MKTMTTPSRPASGADEGPGADRPASAEMPFRLRRLGGNLGAEVSGVDLTRPLSDKTFAALYDAFVRYEVLVFRDQDVTLEQQMAFGRRFGELSIHPFSPNLDDKRETPAP